MREVDLSNIIWNNLSTTSFGILPKCIDKSTFIKLSVYNENVGFYGDEPVYEYLASMLGEIIGINIMRTELVLAKVLYKGKYYKTLASIHNNFKDQCENFISMEKYNIKAKNSNILETLLKDDKYKSSLEDMIVFDFLINNIDRHGRNVEINSTSLAPLFDNSMSFFSKIEDNLLNTKFIQESFRCNNYLGYPDLKDNLDYVKEYKIGSSLDNLLEVVDTWGKETKRTKIRVDFIKNLLTWRYNYIENKYSNRIKW